jgi:hypothetical protein
VRLLHEQGFTLQGTRKALEGDDHPDRDAQFQYIHDLVEDFMADGVPVVSIDTKKKELVGEFTNRGREWHAQGEGPDVLTHDFPNGVPKAVPYGVYDLARNTGWVSVGTSSDTAEFATATLGRWWKEVGKAAYPLAKGLLVTADCGGSNGYRVRLWRLMLQKLAHETGLAITVAHFPPGTSKWNKIEHRMFSLISMNWRGRPLVSYEAIVSLIGSTTSTKGLTIRCELDEGTYLKGQRVADRDLEALTCGSTDGGGVAGPSRSNGRWTRAASVRRARVGGTHRPQLPAATSADLRVRLLADRSSARGPDAGGVGRSPFTAPTGQRTHSSPRALRSTSATRWSSRRNPAARSSPTTGAAVGITPCRAARTTKPRVPITGIPSARAQRRP